MSHIVIIGSGHAGLSLARELRAKDANCKITLLSKETICAYYKPNLSKALSSGKTADQLIMKTAEMLSEELDIHCLSHAEVMHIDSSRQNCSYHCIENEAIMELHYDKLVLATGASPIRLPTTVANSKHVLAINNLDQYRQFRDQLIGKQSVVIIGAGYIGCELASDLSNHNIQVSIIDRGAWPLSRAVPQALGSVIQERMATQQSVSWYLGKTLECIEQKDNLFSVHLSSGESIKADLVISAIGLQANLKLAQLAGAKTGLGIQVDAYSASSVSNIYALGDCAEYQEKLLPFIAPITAAAKTLAKTLTGEPCALSFPANAVPVKLSACPTVICPSHDSRGIWEVQGSGTDMEAHFINASGELSGFALTGAAVKRKTDLLKLCKGLTIAPAETQDQSIVLSQAC
tara:strand:+ start:13193 stop:14404 length:1212 start_codon:yes stop_codon:yes gene_type:complete